MYSMASQEAIDNELVRGTKSDRAAVLATLLEKNHTEFSMLVHGTLHNHLPHVSSILSYQGIVLD